MLTLLFLLSITGLGIGILLPLATSGTDLRTGRTTGYACIVLSSILLAGVSSFLLFTGQILQLTIFQPFPGVAELAAYSS